MSFQFQSKGKKEKNKGFHVLSWSARHMGPSAHNTSWAEAIYPDISYCSPLSVWFKGPSCLSRTRCQVEPSSAVRHISMAQVPEVWLPSGQGRGPGYYSPFQEDSRAVFVFDNFTIRKAPNVIWKTAKFFLNFNLPFTVFVYIHGFSNLWSWWLISLGYSFQNFFSCQ